MAESVWAAAIDQQEIATRVGKIDIKDKPANTTTATQPTAAGDGTGTSTGPGTENSNSTEADDAVSKADISMINKKLRDRLVTTKTDLEVLQKDPNSPLYSVKNFEALRLKPELLKGVYAMGFNAPSKIQETALPTLLADPPQNMIAQSQSGTGKTAAFVLTMLSRIDPSLPYNQALCLAPTYELALQIGDVTKSMAKFMPDVKIGFAVRGERVTRGQKVPYHIIIGTPGTLLDWCIKLKAVDLNKVTVFVLDEADVMIDTQGHQDQSIRIQRGLKKNCQMLLFSATYDTDVMRFAQAVVPNPVVIRLRREEESLDNIKQYYIHCATKDMKFQALANIYGTISIGQTMIFCHTRKTASWLTDKMKQEGHAVALLSGDLQVEERADVIKRFRDGKEKVLITTNVSARGIDVEQVTVVVNFDLPVDTQGHADCETYLHRIGRTGRFGKMGIAINMIDGPKTERLLDVIRKHFGKPIESLDPDDMDAIENIAK